MWWGELKKYSLLLFKIGFLLCKILGFSKKKKLFTLSPCLLFFDQIVHDHYNDYKYDGVNLKYIIDRCIYPIK